MGTPEADNRNHRAFEQQQIHDNELKNEYYEENDSFSNFNELD